MTRYAFREWSGRLRAPNLPELAGFAITAVGGLMLLLALKDAWYRVPLDIADDGSLTLARSVWERPLKCVVALATVVGCCMWLRCRHDTFLRARVVFCIGLVGFITGLAFSHMTIIGQAELSHRAAWILSQHDNLTWLGGDIYTAREYEPIGGGLDLMAKDPQQILGSVQLPYSTLDLGSLHDLFDWMGLGAPFTAFKSKGWGFLMVGSIFLMVGALATRMPEERDRLSSRVVSFGLRAAGPAIILYIAIVGARIGIAAKALENARTRGDVADYPAAIASIETAMRVMPCLRYDTGMILQRGLYEHQGRQETAAAKYYHAVLLEGASFKSQAEAAYVELAQADHEPVRREALRALFRLGIIDFNSGQETEALRRTESLIAAFPTLPKARYVRLLLAVRLGETDVAFDCQRKLYTIAGGIGLSEKRSYLSSGHQHLADLAFSDGDFQEAWRQFVNRVQLEQ